LNKRDIQPRQRKKHLGKRFFTGEACTPRVDLQMVGNRCSHRAPTRRDDTMCAIRRGGLFILALLAGNLLLTLPAAAQQRDPLKETQDRLRVEEQRLETIVSDALFRSDQIGKNQPRRAVEILREAKAQLETDKEALKPERRESLVRKLTLRIRTWEEV